MKMKIEQEKDGAAAQVVDLTAVMMSQQSENGQEGGAPEQVCGDRLSQEGREASTGALRWSILWTVSGHCEGVGVYSERNRGF